MTEELLKEAVELALKIRKNAHAVYSNFAVGAVIITKSGKIYPGVNVENSSYGATVCAERVALFNAVTDGNKDFSAIVIASELKGKAVFPCGICRQVLADFNPDMDVYLVNSLTGSVERKVALREIFPEHFEFHK